MMESPNSGPAPVPPELLTWATKFWAVEALPKLEDFVRIPCLSPDFDPQWAESGELLRAAHFVCDWARRQPVAGLSAELRELPGRTPLVVIDVPAHRWTRSSRPTLIYGHLDKQPAMGEWRSGDAFSPTLIDDRLYGRGAADDGYALFAGVGALRALQENGIGHGRCVIILEASEESTSVDLEPHLAGLREAQTLGADGPGLIIGLDSSCVDYERLWITTSLRGHLVATLRVDVLDHAVHSGDWGGVVPCSFRILRHLLSRIEDDRTARVLVDECRAELPPHRRAQVQRLVDEFGDAAVGDRPGLTGTDRPVSASAVDDVLAQTWDPTLTVTGVDGIPSLLDAGSVLRPFTTAKLSVRLSPTVDPAHAATALRAVLVPDPPAGARVSFDILNLGAGFDAPASDEWLAATTEAASSEFFGRPAISVGQGGSNPFLSTMRRAFPDAQFVATGLLGPESNAHAADEMLHLPTATKLTACIAHVISQVCRHQPESIGQESR